MTKRMTWKEWVVLSLVTPLLLAVVIVAFGMTVEKIGACQDQMETSIK
jgi:hypothetical protein